MDTLGRGRLLTWMHDRAEKVPVNLVEEIFVGLAAQTITVPGTTAAKLFIPHLPANIKTF